MNSDVRLLEHTKPRELSAHILSDLRNRRVNVLHISLLTPDEGAPLLKIAHPSRRDALRIEKMWAMQAAKTRFAPHVFALPKWFDDVMVTARIENSSLTGAQARSFEVAARVVKSLASLHGELGTMATKLISKQTLVAKARRGLEHLRKSKVRGPFSIVSLQERLEVIDREYNRMNLSSVVSHGDFWHGNILEDREKQRLTFVDWGSVAFWDRYADLAQYLVKCDFPAEQLEEIFHIYLNEKPSNNQLRALSLSIAMTNLQHYALFVAADDRQNKKPSVLAMCDRLRNDEEVLPDLRPMVLQPSRWTDRVNK